MSEKGGKYDSFGKRIPNRIIFQQLSSQLQESKKSIFITEDKEPLLEEPLLEEPLLEGPIIEEPLLEEPLLEEPLLEEPIHIPVVIEKTIWCKPTNIIENQPKIHLYDSNYKDNSYKPIDESIIPLNIFQTWHSLELPEKMRECVEKIKQENPEFHHYLFDDAMCEAFIHEYFPEEVVYSFRKLRPGAYKSDLWRYCILYIYGGIYIDIKFHCIHGFRLIYLTDKEYWVRDRFRYETNGIYQAFMVCLPRNRILWNCIQEIVKNVKNNYYENELAITGPILVSQFFLQKKIKELELSFGEDGKYIYFLEKPILEIYNEYREEQNARSLLSYYSHLHHIRNVYQYPCLIKTQEINLSRTIPKIINRNYLTFFSCNPSILICPTNPQEYIINNRWVNYEYNVDGSRKTEPLPYISLNSRFKMNREFQVMNKEIFLEDNFETRTWVVGMEDIRMFYFAPENQIYYSASIFDIETNYISSSCYTYHYDRQFYKLKPHIIKCDFYDLDKCRKIEKNWSYFDYHHQLCVVYKWFPLSIGKIDFHQNKLSIIEYKYDIPDYFQDARGSTPGFTYKNEIWFVLHKSQNYLKNEKERCYHYQHFFAVFDTDMHLLRYSELFTFHAARVEFCIGLILEEERMVMTYSALDMYSYIGVYDHEYIRKGIRWYLHST